ncbi:hypothetical protein [Prevotella pallens]|uniref:hypothetical protein n=1 Tax=Prevotella pallens TaxID=60133 RepID=UPI0028E7707E|nr:hypothetical protein [Prevotella pallens]
MMVKYVFDEMNAGIWRIGYVYLVMWKHIFDDVRIRHDESVPYAWRSVREAFRGCTWLFAECSWIFRGWVWLFCGMLGTGFGF